MTKVIKHIAKPLLTHYMAELVLSLLVQLNVYKLRRIVQITILMEQLFLQTQPFALN